MNGSSPVLDPFIFVLWLVVGVAALWDLSTRRIPNQLIVIGLLLGAASQLIRAGGWGLLHALLGAFAGLGLLIVPFSLRVLGGGDVKLTMVCGAFLGVGMMLEITILASLLHGMMTLGVLGWRSFRTWRTGHTMPTQGLPYALPVALGVALTTSNAVRLFETGAS